MQAEFRSIDISNYHRTGLVFEVVRRDRHQDASAVSWLESGSQSLLRQFVQKSLPLFARQEFEET